MRPPCPLSGLSGSLVTACPTPLCCALLTVIPAPQCKLLQAKLTLTSSLLPEAPDARICDATLETAALAVVGRRPQRTEPPLEGPALQAIYLASPPFRALTSLRSLAHSTWLFGACFVVCLQGLRCPRGTDMLRSAAQRARCALQSAGALQQRCYKTETGLVGLPVDPKAREHLREGILRVLDTVKEVPDTAEYRKNVESTFSSRCSRPERAGHLPANACRTRPVCV